MIVVNKSGFRSIINILYHVKRFSQSVSFLADSKYTNHISYKRSKKTHKLLFLDNTMTTDISIVQGNTCKKNQIQSPIVLI